MLRFVSRIRLLRMGESDSDMPNVFRAAEGTFTDGRDRGGCGGSGCGRTSRKVLSCIVKSAFRSLEGSTLRRFAGLSSTLSEVIAIVGRPSQRGDITSFCWNCRIVADKIARSWDDLPLSHSGDLCYFDFLLGQMAEISMGAWLPLCVTFPLRQLPEPSSKRP